MNVEIIDTNAENILRYGVCGYKDIKRAGYPEKLKKDMALYYWTNV
jgi:hypothetical protein